MGMRNWAGLLEEMLCLIFDRVDTMKDLVAFGGVCSTWRGVAVQQNLGQPLLPLPWLMLAENKDDDSRDFYSVTEDKIYSFGLPELRGKKCMETKGWIVTASDKGEMALVHSLTHVVIPLPHQNTSEIYQEHCYGDHLIFLSSVVLSSSPDPTNERDCVIAILHGDLGHLGFCRPGDTAWSVAKKNYHGGAKALEYYRGKFYVLNNRGHLWEYDLIGRSSNAPVLQRRIGVNIETYLNYRQPYLVESEGSLLAIFRSDVDDDAALEFWILDIDVERFRYEEKENLGTRAIFLGHSATLSVDTILYPELIPNSIYFTDDCFTLDELEGQGKNMGIYSLDDKSVRPHYKGNSLSLVCPPIWTFLSTKKYLS